jgi:hypothetical protein
MHRRSPNSTFDDVSESVLAAEEFSVVMEPVNLLDCISSPRRDEPVVTVRLAELCEALHANSTATSPDFIANGASASRNDA